MYYFSIISIQWYHADEFKQKATNWSLVMVRNQCASASDQLFCDPFHFVQIVFFFLFFTLRISDSKLFYRRTTLPMTPTATPNSRTESFKKKLPTFSKCDTFLFVSRWFAKMTRWKINIPAKNRRKLFCRRTRKERCFPRGRFCHQT